MNGIILLGPPGSGKSTVGRELAKQLNMVYVSSGDIARRLAEKDEWTSESLDSGGMANEDLMRKEIYGILYEINVRNREFVLDGFPRFEEQWEWLRGKFPIIKSVFVDTPVYKCIDRLRKRGRRDDVNGVMDNRFDFYTGNTQPMIDKHITDSIIIHNVATVEDTVAELVRRLSNENS